MSPLCDTILSLSLSLNKGPDLPTLVCNEELYLALDIHTDIQVKINEISSQTASRDSACSSNF